MLPVRVPAHTEGASAPAPQKADTTFIRDDATTREEILQKLGWMDTGVKNQRLFVGRWVSSNWGVFMAAASQGSGGADWIRNWHRQTLLVGFDEKGVVRQHRMVPDKELARDLAAWLAQNSPEPLELSPPLEIHVEDSHSGRLRPAALILEKDSFAYRPDDTTDNRNFRIPPDQIRSLSVNWAMRRTHGAGPDPRYLLQTIHFTKKTPAGNALTVRADMPTAVILFKYFAETRSPASPQVSPTKEN